MNDRIGSSQDKKSYRLTKSALSFDQNLAGELIRKVDILGPIDTGNVRTFFRLTTEYPVVTVVGLGPEEATINEEEQINEKRENVRAATAAGYNAINALDVKIESVEVDDCGDPQSAVEGVFLASYRFEELKSKKDSDAEIQISLLYPTEATLKEW